jgi:hypothetical protein
MKWWLVIAGALWAGAARAGDEKPAPAGSAAEQKKLEEQIARDLGVDPAAKAPAAQASSATPASSTAPAPAPSGGGVNPYARLLLLPDLSVLGRGALVYDRLDTAVESPRGDLVSAPRKLDAVFQELELAVQAVVDPYARGDVFLTFTPRGAAVEEAYLTTLSLPGGLQARTGIFHAPFGRLSPQHPHVWDFADAPLAQARLLSPDSFGGPGVTVAWLAPVPWFAELHLAYQETTPAFEAAPRRTGLARLSQFVDLADGLTLGVGLSGARLDEARGAWRDLLGADLFLKYRPPGGRRYGTLQGELFQSRLGGLADPAANGTWRGGYLQALWRIDAFWALGLRGEAAPAQVPLAALGTFSGSERRLTGLLSWYLTEFQRLRLQVGSDRLPGGRSGFEATLALDFSMGIHGAHPF